MAEHIVPEELEGAAAFGQLAKRIEALHTEGDCEDYDAADAIATECIGEYVPNVGFRKALVNVLLTLRHSIPSFEAWGDDPESMLTDGGARMSAARLKRIDAGVAAVAVAAADRLNAYVDVDAARKATSVPIDELTGRLSALAAASSHSGQRVIDLADVAIAQLPNDTAVEGAAAVLEALRDRALKASNEHFELNHLLVALIDRVEADHA